VDVIDYVTSRIKAGDPIDVASERARVHYSELEADNDEGPLLWIALAYVQWKYGSIQTDTLDRVRKDILNERGLDPWRDDRSALEKRKAALGKFLQQIQVPNPKPTAIPKIVVRKAPFRQGDCLSVLLSDGRYTAALVLQEDNSDPEYGKNLIASLDYCERDPPEMAVFERKEWLVLSHSNWKGERDICWYLPVRFQKERKRICVVGNVGAIWKDKSTSWSYVGWGHLGLQVLLCRAHSGKQNA
jgi:hypothetical protein